MSRNKENNPFPAQRRVSIASLDKNLPSEDFFTDSIIDDSRIPSPSPNKASPAKPRRAVGVSKALQAARDSGNKAQRYSLAHYTTSRAHRALKTAPLLARKKSPSPLPLNNGATTPPPSKTTRTPTSPTAEFSSPPGGLSDVYQRIQDEEDLAATEREMDSDDDLEAGPQDTLESDMAVDVPDMRDPHEQHTSPAATPLPAGPSTMADVQEDNSVEIQADDPSQPPTLDFLQNELTDRVLAAKLTPGVLDRAKDRARLERLRTSQIPIDFHKGIANGPDDALSTGKLAQSDIASILQRPPLDFNSAIVSNLTDDHVPPQQHPGSAPQQRLKAFSRATRLSPHHHSVSGGSEDGGPDSPEFPQSKRIVAFSRASRTKRPFGQDEYSPPLKTAANAELLEVLEAHVNQASPPASTANSEPQPATRSFLAKWRQDAAEKRMAKMQSLGNQLQIDWAAAAKDDIVPSIEPHSPPRHTAPQDPVPSSMKSQRSADRLRRWDNDFTGLSFQVSESPPVRSKPSLSDSVRDREIEDLAKKAVTTNRLDEMREKDPDVIVRKTSRNFSSDEPKLADSELHGDGVRIQPGDQQDQDDDSRPGTPAVVYKSSDADSGRPDSSQRSASDSQNSLEQLQRLARAVSTTPRDSPRIADINKEDPSDADDEVDDVSLVSKAVPAAQTSSQRTTIPKVANTPKVTGAWTDTILPDTVRTTRQQSKQPKYMATPHVSAGGWVDTPLPNGSGPSQAIPTIVEEVVEEPTDALPESDVIRPTASQSSSQPEKVDADKVGADAMPAPPSQGHIVLPKSVLSNVLNEAKQKRLVSRDITEAPDDTLNLGDATIQSFEDLLTDAVDISADLTSLIRTGAEDEVAKHREFQFDGDANSTAAEVAFIGHLTSRMERLMSNLHEARKGISRLEHKVSQSPVPTEKTQLQSLQSMLALQKLDQPCAICAQTGDSSLHPFHAVSVSSHSVIPYSLVTLPVPLLFHPRQKGRLLARPTWFGWLTITVWTWYALECTMCELYSRPLYADHYAWPTKQEPEFPFVLPTMLWRWSYLGPWGPGVLGLLWRLVIAVYRVIAMSLGLIDGFTDDDLAAISADAGQAATTALHASNSVFPGNSDGIDLSMMNDEFL